MVAKGVVLTDISQVLRHRDLATTAIYAKVDLDSLRMVARPWPGLPSSRPGPRERPSDGWDKAMTALAEALSDYLTLRNRLGHKLADSVRVLPRFVAWMDATDQSTVTIAAALEWCQQQPSTGPDSVIWAHRMTAVRGFARYLSGIDPATQIPPLGLLPERRHWTPPYIYTPDDVATLLRGARQLRSPLRAATYETLFGLLATTGMRVGEAIRLDQTDLDYETGVILIRESKFGKSRLVPVDASTVVVLRDYADRRAEFRVQPGNDSFFVSLTGRRLIYESVHEVFRTAPRRDRARRRLDGPPGDP